MENSSIQILPKINDMFAAERKKSAENYVRLLNNSFAHVKPLGTVLLLLSLLKLLTNIYATNHNTFQCKAMDTEMYNCLAFWTPGFSFRTP